MLQSEFEILLIKETKRLMLRMRQHIYEQEERAGRLLSHQLWQSLSSRLISEINYNSGLIKTDHIKINDTFKQYYSNLYCSQNTADPSDMDSFMTNVNTPTISQYQRAILENSFSEHDILQAISSLQSGKTPGPDGFPCEFYKALSSKLSPLLCAVFSEIHTKDLLPQTFTQATISVTLKTGKGPQ